VAREGGDDSRTSPNQRVVQLRADAGVKASSGFWIIQKN
jgi:hypothetical protein